MKFGDESDEDKNQIDSQFNTRAPDMKSVMKTPKMIEKDKEEYKEEISFEQ